MVLHILRALFVMLMAAAGYHYLGKLGGTEKDPSYWSMSVALIIGVALICVDILAPRRKLMIFSGTFFGLVVGITIAYALSFVVRLLADRYLPPLGPEGDIVAQTQTHSARPISFW